MEEPVTFYNKNGKKLFGIVHVPEQSAVGSRKIGINLLNPGIKYRVAPHRLNVKVARELCRRGYFVLRFDPEGIGDSEGELPDAVFVADIWEKIQTGLFVEDTITANNFFFENYGIDSLLFAGNCGGAISALIASARDPRVQGACLIDVPVNLRSAQMSFADKVAEGGEKADWLFTEYIKRLFRLKSWYRLVTMQTSYRALWKTVQLKVMKKMKPVPEKGIMHENLEALCSDRKLNRLFFESFDAVIRREVPLLFVLAGNDPGTEIFQYYFQKGILDADNQKGRYDQLVDIFLIDGANHIYTLTPWQEALIDKVSGWIEAKACATSSAAV